MLDDLPDGGDDALEKLIRHAREQLRRKSRKMLRQFPKLRSQAETDDVLQQSLIRLTETLRRGKRPATSLHFYKMASLLIRRELVDMSRRDQGRYGQRPRQLTNQGWSVGEDARLVGDEEGGREPISLKDWAEFHEAVAMMPEDLREVFDLEYYQGLSQERVATLLCVSLRTVKRRWQGARIWLATRLCEEESR